MTSLDSIYLLGNSQRGPLIDIFLQMNIKTLCKLEQTSKLYRKLLHSKNNRFWQNYVRVYYASPNFVVGNYKNVCKMFEQETDCRSLSIFPALYLKNRYSSLKTLEVTSIGIIEIPPNFGSKGTLKNLESLIIINTSIKTLPASFGTAGTFNNLRSMTLKKNIYLECLPDSFAEPYALPSLEKLYISDVTCLPEHFGLRNSLPNLLDLTLNDVICVGEDFGSMEFCPELEHIHINDGMQYGSTFSEDLSFQNLKYLTLTHLANSTRAVYDFEYLDCFAKTSYIREIVFNTRRIAPRGF